MIYFEGGVYMKHILRDNALEAWAMAIKYRNYILAGKATLQYRKQFVSSLHNAVELFVKQLMLDNNDHRVCRVKNIKDSEGHPLVDFFNADDLNYFFEHISDDEMRQFYSVEYNQIRELTKELFKEYYGEHQKDKNIVDQALLLLGRLRNDEAHFYIGKIGFLVDIEFEKLHNFMIVFGRILHYYSLLPYWGEEFGEFVRYKLKNKELKSFSYKKAVVQSEFYQKLKGLINGHAVPEHGDTTYDYAECIYWQFDDKEIDFGDLWTCIEMAVQYDLLEYDEIVEEYDEPEMGTGANRYRTIYLK